jgi:hypothetical protein
MTWTQMPMIYSHAQFIQALSEILSRLSSLCQILNDSSNSILNIEAKLSPLFLLGLEFLHANITIAIKNLKKDHTVTSSTICKVPQAALFKGGNASADTLVSQSSARLTSPTSFKTVQDDMVQGRCVQRKLQRRTEQRRTRRRKISTM